MAFPRAARELRYPAWLGRRRPMARRRWRRAAAALLGADDGGDSLLASPDRAAWPRRRRRGYVWPELGRTREWRARGARWYGGRGDEGRRYLRHRDAGRRRLWEKP